MWSILRGIKLETSLDMTCGTIGIYNNMISDIEMVKKVEQNLKINSSDEIYKNITAQELEVPAMMYLYLNTCPGIYRPWFTFYKILFQTQSPDQIILTLNRLMKGTTTPKNKFLKGLAQNVFQRLASLLSLRYEEIQSMSQSQGMTNNESLPAHERNQRLTFKGNILSRSCFSSRICLQILKI